MRCNADSLFLFYLVMYSMHWSISAALIPWAFNHSMSRDINRFILMLPRSLLPVCNRFLITVLLYHGLSYLSIGKSRFFVIFLFFFVRRAVGDPRAAISCRPDACARASGSPPRGAGTGGGYAAGASGGGSPFCTRKNKKNNYEKRLTSSRNYDIMLS